MLSTMVYADEINAARRRSRSWPSSRTSRCPTRSWRWPGSSSTRCPSTSSREKFQDTYREAVLELIERKAAGEEVVAPAAGDRARQGDRPDGRARGVGRRGQAVARPSPDRRERTRPSDERRAAGQGGPDPEGAGARSPPEPVAAPTVVDIDGHELKLSNLDKVLYPEVGFTKGEVIDYYARVAPDDARPTSPGGASRSGGSPTASTASRSSRSGARRTDPTGSTSPSVPATAAARSSYCLLDDRAALVWAANLAALELHTPMARAADIETPDDGGVRPRSGAAGGHDRVRRRWRSTSATPSTASTSALFPKTSGSKGLQLYLPLNTPHTHDHASRVRAGAGPADGASTTRDRVVSNMKKELRKGKVLIDWSQNSRHKTTVCAYSLAGPTPPDRVDAGDLGRGRGGRRRRRARVRGRRRARPDRRPRRSLRPHRDARTAPPAQYVLNLEVPTPLCVGCLQPVSFCLAPLSGPMRETERDSAQTHEWVRGLRQLGSDRGPHARPNRRPERVAAR